MCPRNLRLAFGTMKRFSAAEYSKPDGKQLKKLPDMRKTALKIVRKDSDHKLNTMMYWKLVHLFRESGLCVHALI